MRDTLGLMARRIQAEPWTADFEREIETKTLPDLIEQLVDRAFKVHSGSTRGYER